MKTINLPALPAGALGRLLSLLLLAVLLFTGAAVSAASPSELLEQGIYTEETRGDVDAALKLYQQVITEAKATQAVAAQAQYRLGVCYYKKKHYGQANEAFQKLVADYPDQKDLIALANKYLANAMPLMPAPWVDGEEMNLDIKFATGFRIGMAQYRVESGELQGRKIWKLGTRVFATTQQASRVEVEADSFKPIHCWWRINLIGAVDVNYLPGAAEVKMLPDGEVKKIDLGGVVYDNEEVIQLIRRLPLAPDYKTQLKVLTGLGGGNIIPLEVAVVGQEKVEVPAGTFDCYKIDLKLVRQQFWFSADSHHYLVKFEAGGAIAVLTSVTQRAAGAPVTYQDSAFPFSLSAPSGWLFFRIDNRENKDTAKVVVLDPDGVATTAVSVIPQKVDPAKPLPSLREWVEKDLLESDEVKVLKGLKIRPDSWQERKLAGQPAISLVGDFEESDEKKTGCAVVSRVGTNTVVFTLMAPAKDFETFKPKFEAVVDAFKMK